VFASGESTDVPEESRRVPRSKFLLVEGILQNRDNVIHVEQLISWNYPIML